MALEYARCPWCEKDPEQRHLCTHYGFLKVALRDAVRDRQNVDDNCRWCEKMQEDGCCSMLNARYGFHLKITYEDFSCNHFALHSRFDNPGRTEYSNVIHQRPRADEEDPTLETMLQAHIAAKDEHIRQLIKRGDEVLKNDCRDLRAAWKQACDRTGQGEE